jgi:peptidoglycan-associated lipoprotein
MRNEERQIMKNRALLRVVALGCVCVVVGSGCRFFRKKNAAGTDTDLLKTEVVPGDIPFGTERVEGGELVAEAVGKFRNVQFAFDSFQIENSEIPKIEAAASYMKENPRFRLTVEGHCDERGTREYNMSLGESRALAVRAYLVRLGIDGSRVQTKSYGEEKPLDPAHTESAWTVNRRAEFLFYR